MKCPKCSYISFDESARCRNCGYDFGGAADEPAPVDGPLRGGDAEGPLADLSLKDERRAPARPAPTPAPALDLPLFDEPVPGLDDTPLISSPSPPRAPLSVRRATPDPSRVPRPPRPKGARPAGAPEEIRDRPGVVPPPAPRVQPTVVSPARPSAAEAFAPTLLDAADDRGGSGEDTARTPAEATPAARASSTDAPAAARLAALAIDLGLLGLINLAVVHFTLSIVGYPWHRVIELPLPPLVAFCVLLDAGYFVLLTTASGQTLGKMFTGIRVVGRDAAGVGAPQAALRTVLAPLSLLTLGLGYLPALIGGDRRSLHDRLSHTRVVRA